MKLKAAPPPFAHVGDLIALPSKCFRQKLEADSYPALAWCATSTALGL
jgi:hypothetical protein